MFPITPRSADGSNSRRGVCRAVYLANRRARSFAAKPPPAARLQERHKVGRRPEAGQVNESFATQSTPKADIHRHDGDVRFVMNGHARRWSKAPRSPVRLSIWAFTLVVARSRRLAQSTMLSIFLRCWLVYACGSKRRLCSGQARLLGAPQGPKPSEGL